MNTLAKDLCHKGKQVVQMVQIEKCYTLLKLSYVKECHFLP